MTLQVAVDADKCIGSGACVLACPEVFAQDEGAIVRLLDDHPAPALEERVRQAEQACPAQVITVVEE
jgi:ferredoxin